MTDPILPPPADKPPPPKTTTELAAVPQWAIELTVAVKGIASKVDGLYSAVDHVTEVQTAHGMQLTGLIEWKGSVEERFKSHSMRASSTYEIDSKQDIAIAHLAEQVDGVTKKLEGDDAFRKLLVDTTKEALGSPMVKRFGQAAAAAAIAALTYLTAYLQLRGGH